MNFDESSPLTHFIKVIDGGLPTSMSERLLAEYESSDRWAPATVDIDRSGAGVRNCDILDMAHPDTRGTSDVRQELLDDVTTLAGEWARAYEAAYVPMGLTGRNGVGIARYRTGGYYRSHHDHHPDEIRTITMIAVLESDFTGGELAFFRGRHVVALQPGQACLFPATFQYPHSVEPVRSGTRYSLISWLH